MVVRDGKTHWQVDDGQYALELDVSVSHGELRVVERHEPTEDTTKQPRDWFSEGLQLETVDPRAAQEAYERAVDDDPHNAAAWINLGRLLHEHGGKRGGVGLSACTRACGPDSLLMFNLGVVLEDLGRPGAALDAYQSALEKIRTWRTATTTSRGCTKRSASRSTRSGTSVNTAGW